MTLRDQIAELRISKLANTIGADGFARCPLLPFWTKTGRNQPAGNDKIFLPALPAWLHGIIAPPPGWAIAELDWDGQEIGIMAGLSGDPAMIEDYRSGDPHLSFGRRVKLLPLDATKDSHREERNRICKPIVLGELRHDRLWHRRQDWQVVAVGAGDSRPSSPDVSGLSPVGSRCGGAGQV